jgi:UDP-GlcNAc3NAcA epimerase
MKIITVIGARPQFIKAAVVSRAIQQIARQGVNIQESILHTGQHYDYTMSELFFRQLHLPEPQWHLNCGNDIVQMRQAITPILDAERPDIVLVYGDTYSTLAGATTAHALHIPVAHIEAGLRSFNNTMPEERNRIETDKIATWLFCPTKTAVDNLHKEGYTDGIYHVGDVMYDAALTFTPDKKEQDKILKKYNVSSKHFILATIHRAATADNVEALMQIFTAFAQIKSTILLPLHPHTAKTIANSLPLQHLVKEADNVHIIEPVGYIDTLTLEHHAQYIMTDSGGMQKEAYFQRTPCITLRNETEWIETIQAGWNRLAGTDTDSILQALSAPFDPQPIDEYGDGHASEKIITKLLNNP